MLQGNEREVRSEQYVRECKLHIMWDELVWWEGCLQRRRKQTCRHVTPCLRLNEMTGELKLL